MAPHHHPPGGRVGIGPAAGLGQGRAGHTGHARPGPAVAKVPPARPPRSVEEGPGRHHAVRVDEQHGLVLVGPHREALAEVQLGDRTPARPPGPGPRARCGPAAAGRGQAGPTARSGGWWVSSRSTQPARSTAAGEVLSIVTHSSSSRSRSRPGGSAWVSPMASPGATGRPQPSPHWPATRPGGLLHQVAPRDHRRRPGPSRRRSCRPPRGARRPPDTSASSRPNRSRSSPVGGQRAALQQLDQRQGRRLAVALP